MVRARSRFFFLTLTIWWASTGLVALYSFLRRPNSDVRETWRDNASLVASTTDIILWLTIGLGVVGSILIVLEILVRLGWEPGFLETFLPGCEILELNPLSEGNSSVIVMHADGRIETYTAEKSEANELSRGYICHLWVIGQYVSRSRQIQSVVSPTPSHRWRKFVYPDGKSPVSAWAFMIVTFLASAYFFALGGLVGSTGNFVLSSGQRKWNGGPRSSFLFEGIGANLVGILIALVALGLFAWIVYQWRFGWNENFSDEWRDDQPT